MSITDLIRWFVQVVGSLAALAAAIQCLIGLVKLVKEIMDGVDKGFSIRKAFRERKAEKSVIIPGTPQAFREVVEWRAVRESSGPGWGAHAESNRRSEYQRERLTPKVRYERVIRRVPVEPEPPYQFRIAVFFLFVAIAVVCFWLARHLSK